MTPSRRVIGFASVLLIAIVLPPVYMAASAGPSHLTIEAASTDGIAATLSMVSHPMTQDEVNDLKARLGLGASGTTYEPVKVDGFSTGLTPRTDAQWQALVDEILVFEVESLPAAAPSSFDLSGDPEFPAVGNQASQGSCSAWAATYYSYGYLEAVDNEWTEASSGNPEQLLSPAWTYNMVNEGVDQGSWVDTNMMVIRDWGVATMATMPYDDGDFTSWGSPEAFREAPLHRASEVGTLEYSPSTTIDAIKALVAAGTPVTFAMDASEYASGFSDGNYIISSSEYSSTSLNHAQTIVGYDDLLADDSDVGAFKVVNSWGPDWGDSGYYWFTYSALKELGSLGVLHLNFIVDVLDYEPSLLGVWHFDSAPSRAASVSVSVGSTPSAEDTKEPFYVSSFNTRLTFPRFMCLDMTEHTDVFWSDGGMHLSVGDARTDGLISSFKAEVYEPSFEAGRATQASGQSDDVPASTPAVVSTYLEYYAPMTVGDALESPTFGWSSSGQAGWVPVDHHSSGDGDSMQTGDVADGAWTVLETLVDGPADVTFDWSVSSQSGNDVLSFLIDDAVTETVSGYSGWTTVTSRVQSGTHALSWLYTKDGSTSSGEDAGWLDSVSIVSYIVQPPVIVLDDSYLTETEVPFTIEPVSLEHPAESVVTVWYDWGDLTSWSESTQPEGYSATHEYAAAGTYTLTAYAADDSGNNVSDSASVRVLTPNEIPVIGSVEVSPSTDHFLPSETVTFTISVSDLEGGALTVVSSYGDSSGGDSSTIESVLPGAVIELEFTHCYPEGSDVAYSAVFTVEDDDEHVNPEWHSAGVEVLVNSPPIAALRADPESAGTGALITFDASSSSDAETDSSSLLYRWDWNGDEVFDTGWASSPEASRSYDASGVYDITVEVMDGAGLVSSASVTVDVVGDAIPEFSMLIVPVIGMVLVVLVARLAQRR